MSDDDFNRIIQTIADGLDRSNANLSSALPAFQTAPIDCLTLLKEATTFVKDLTFTETPDDPEDIQNLDKEEIVFATYRVNFFEKLRIPALNDDQLKALYRRTTELWGDHPTEPRGRWVEWCLWTHLHRRRNGVAITEVVAGDKAAQELKETWIERHRAREDRRRLRKIDNYERYKTPEDVPKSIREVILSPFITDPEMTEIEIESEDLPESQRDSDARQVEE